MIHGDDLTNILTMSNKKALETIEVLTTGDGSPTARLNNGEKMHSMEGAFSETLYIYGECFRYLEELPSPRVLSMGFGLGYNEWMSLGFMLKTKRKLYQIQSFESVDCLYQCFLEWLNSQEKQEALWTPPSPLYTAYSTLLALMSEHFKLSQESFVHGFLDGLNQEQIVLNPQLDMTSKRTQPFQIILYDAYSGQSDGHLWSEEHLNSFLETYAAETCVLTTYAATGNLNRALKKQGFSVTHRKGFGKKRQSTWATRGLSK